MVYQRQLDGSKDSLRSTGGSWMVVKTVWGLQEVVGGY